jgi:putative DNA primase/helicase
MMAIDLNDALEQRQHTRVDMGALETGLRDHVDRWVPELFPQGWRSDSGDEWVVGDISGKRPSGNGSCHIGLKGQHAGDWHDFSIGKGGQVFSTIKERFRLGQGEVIREALRILEECGVAVERIEGERPKREPRPSRAADHTNDAAHEWKKGGLLAGTPGERYIYRRGGRVPLTDDLGFSTDCVRFYSTGVAVGQDAIIALFRYPDGTPSGGIHRIYLKRDGSWHDGKKMLGPVDGAVVMLGQPCRGLLGIAEGIETTAAAMSLFGGVSGWAAGSAGGLERFGQWLVAHPGWAWQAGIRRLLIWADARKAGEDAGRSLLAACRTAGVDAQLWLPRGGDDFADDAIKGLLPGVPLATTRDTEVLVQREPGELDQ